MEETLKHGENTAEGKFMEEEKYLSLVAFVFKTRFIVGKPTLVL